MTTIGVHPTRLDLAAYGGQAIDVSIPVLDATGAPVLAPGWTASAQIRDTTGQAGTLLADLAVTLAAGVVRVQATGVQTRTWCTTWTALKVPWDLVVTDPDQIPHPLAAGWVTLAPHITR